MINFLAQANEKPYFTSTPYTSINVDVFYNYQITVADPDNDSLNIILITKPDWLWFENYGNDTAALKGTPTSHDGIVSLAVTDGIDTVYQEFTITVYCYNCCFIFTTTPRTTVAVGNEYVYLVQADDVDIDTIFISIDTIPDWISAKNNNFNGLLLYGTPSIEDTGIFEISIKGEKKGLCPEVVYQQFNLTVTKPLVDAIEYSSIENRFQITPNPFTEELIISMDRVFLIPIYFEIYNSLGQLIFGESINYQTDNIKLDLSFLKPDRYYLRIRSQNTMQTRIMIKQ
jgi:hypothetical protein